MQARYVRPTFHTRATRAIDVHQFEAWKHVLASSHELHSFTDACSAPYSKELVRSSAMTNQGPRKFDGRPSLLLVDDDIALCEDLAEALAARGFEVQLACTGEQAARLVNDDPPQHAVIALNLPDYSGLKLVSRFLALDPHTRIVVWTA